jgi:hypothetical protein
MKNDTPDALNDLIQFNADWDKAMIENDVRKSEDLWQITGSLLQPKGYNFKIIVS